MCHFPPAIFFSQDLVGREAFLDLLTQTAVHLSGSASEALRGRQIHNISQQFEAGQTMEMELEKQKPEFRDKHYTNKQSD